jgi:hypothetical protein
VGFTYNIFDSFSSFCDFINFVMKIEVGKTYLFKFYGNVCQRKDTLKGMVEVELIVENGTKVRDLSKILDRYVVAKVIRIDNISLFSSAVMIVVEEDSLWFYRDKPDHLLQKD